ncbi:MAG: GNAT family N-acetyltransferase [Clostridia bacterium]|nr:GNAT family N-acetyltransferase [Clostridia bacterium]
MDFREIATAGIDLLWELQKLYKAEIGEDDPEPAGKERLAEAIRQGIIHFYGAWKEDTLIGCCSVTAGFSTFDYMPCGVFEDFYIRPEYRHQGIARQLVEFAYHESGVSSLTVGCADCDVQMYQALGFTVALGNLLAFE